MRTLTLVLVLAATGCKGHENPPGAGSGSAVPPPAPPRVVAVEAAPPADAEPTTGEAFALQEQINGIELQDASDTVIERCGTPEKHGKPHVLSYGGAEVTLTKTDSNEWVVASIHVAAPSTWQTKHGIHIGSARADVQKVYTPVAEVDDDAERFLAGTTYLGEEFTFKDGKVVEIFLGAMAE